MILPLLKSDLYEVMQAVINKKLSSSMPVWFEDSAAVTVVMASEGYPGTYPKGLEITGKYSKRNCRSLITLPPLSSLSFTQIHRNLRSCGYGSTEFSYIKYY